VCLRISEECGGQSKLDEKGYLVGAPEWIGEVSVSSASFDLHFKLPLYEKNGVLEYVVWRVDDEEIDWFILKAGKYQRLAKTRDGLYKSKVFPGLWLDPRAMIGGDLAKVLDVVQRGVASPEHKRFVKTLRSRKK
jgi:Putative restriction endonuclease